MEEENMWMLLLAVVQSPSWTLAEECLMADEAAAWEWRVGARLNIATSFGEPANDIIGGSMYGSYRISHPWWITVEAYHGAFDFENPGDAVLGTSGTPTADAKIALTTLMAVGEWHPLEPGGRWDLYVGAGLGLGFTSDGETPKKTGIDIEIDGGFGFVAQVRGGVAFRMFSRVYLTLDGYFGYAFIPLEVRDRVSGDSGTDRSWDIMGGSVGFEVRF
jgi:hypothetical protein